tara:strand:+ start:1579 stop:1704 length:126 start_codon:yes stop_codon:yes gene_type:complete
MLKLDEQGHGLQLNHGLPQEDIGNEAAFAEFARPQQSARRV